MAHSRTWIEQEQNGSATRFGVTRERQGTGQSAAGFLRHGMTAFGQRTDDHERIAVAGFQDAGESGVNISRKRSVLVLIDWLLCRRRSKLGRCRDFRLVQGPSHEGEHAPIDVSCLNLRDNVDLKIRDQLGRVRIASIGTVT